ncbi:MAG: glucose-1-phosphate cytidylyltransferase [Euryarchaeota archaeon]|nr:glucose-1-phosphate cytidylyltransferase [Euryarchaeota archaeon]|tara:strand:+ start:714 stop:1448 length:735 start_codon:yes stop_codon:yes gene_type:complete
MNVFILAGGKGTRFREETSFKPKPMIEINETPMLEHIINHYRFYGLRNFTILAGTKIEYIFEYFNKKYTYLGENTFTYHDSNVLILDTGDETMTGGRVNRGIEMINDENFMLTYGDGISDVNIKDLISFYYKNSFLAVVTAVRPPARFGRLKIEQNNVIEFGEKNQADEGWINGGFFVLSTKIKSYIKDDSTVFEKEPLENLSKEGKLGAFVHNGFWQPVDTIREKEILEDKFIKNQFDWYKNE